MGLFQNRRKANRDDASEVADDLDDNVDLSDAAAMWNAVQAHADSAEEPQPAAPAQRRAEDVAIPPPPADVPAPPAEPVPDPFAAPSALDMIASPLMPPSEVDDPFGLAAELDPPNISPAPDPWATPVPPSRPRVPFEPEGGFIDLSDEIGGSRPTDAVVPEPPLVEPGPPVGQSAPFAAVARPDDSMPETGTVDDDRSDDGAAAPSWFDEPLDHQTLLEVLETGPEPTLDDVAGAHRAFLATHTADDDDEIETVELLRRIRREVNAGYARFRLDQFTG